MSSSSYVSAVSRLSSGRSLARVTATAWPPADAQIGQPALLTLYAVTLLPGGVWTGPGRLLPVLWCRAQQVPCCGGVVAPHHVTQLEQVVGAVTAIVADPDHRRRRGRRFQPAHADRRHGRRAAAEQAVQLADAVSIFRPQATHSGNPKVVHAGSRNAMA